MSKILKALAAAGVAMTLATSASAALVTSWKYTIVSKWTNATGGGPAAVTGNGTQTLAWGTPQTVNGQSKLITADPAADGTLTTNGGPSAGVSITHANNRITNGAIGFTGATLEAALFLAPLTPFEGPYPALPLPQMVDIKFVETPNLVAIETCAVPSTLACRDIFALTNPSQVLGGANFIFDGYVYSLNVFPQNLTAFEELPVAACLAAGLPAGCLGFSTEEQQTTTVPFSITITARPVDIAEPGILALLGLGLAGAGLVVRRRRAA